MWDAKGYGCEYMCGVKEMGKEKEMGKTKAWGGGEYEK